MKNKIIKKWSCVHVEYYRDKKRAEEHYLYPNCSITEARVPTDELTTEMVNEVAKKAMDSNYPYVNVSVTNHVLYEGENWGKIVSIERAYTALECSPKEHFYYCFGTNDMSASADYKEIDRATAEIYQKEIVKGERGGYITNDLTSALYHCQD